LATVEELGSFGELALTLNKPRFATTRVSDRAVVLATLNMRAYAQIQKLQQ
jgi:hypothetical protein